MLKPQDCVLLIKLLAHPEKTWSQRELAAALNMSLSEINAAIKRLLYAGLARKTKEAQCVPIIEASLEFLISALKYLFPGKVGEYTRGMVTGIGAPLFQDKIASGNDPLPVWPDAYGTERGVALKPIYSSIPKALRDTPDQNFYGLLVLVDVIRSGRARERNMAIKMLKDRLE